MSEVPLAPTLLPLLETLANAWLRGREQAGPLRLAAVRLRPEGVELRVAVRQAPAFLAGTYPVWVRVEETTPERTWCRLELPRTPGLSRLLHEALRRLPGQPLNDMLQRLLGEGVRLEGERVVLEHAALAERLLG